MPVDDPAAKDSVVLGPDLVAALGFEPVSADRENGDDQSSPESMPDGADSNGGAGANQDDHGQAAADSSAADRVSDGMELDGSHDASPSEDEAADHTRVEAADSEDDDADLGLGGGAAIAAGLGGAAKGSKRRRFGLGRLQEALGTPVPADNEGGSTRDLFASNHRLEESEESSVEQTGSVNGDADPDALDASTESDRNGGEGSSESDAPGSDITDTDGPSSSVDDEVSSLDAGDAAIGDDADQISIDDSAAETVVVTDDLIDGDVPDTDISIEESPHEAAADHTDTDAAVSTGSVLSDFYDQDESATGETDLVDENRGEEDGFGDDASTSWFDADYDDVDDTSLVEANGTLDIRDREIDLIDPDLEYRSSTTAVPSIPTGPPSFEEVDAARSHEDLRRPVRHKLRARKVRRVIRHIDPWSVLLFSILFHLVIFTSLLLAGILVWNAAIAAGTVENIENFIRELADYETFEIHSDAVFKAGVTIAALATLASATMSVLMTVIFNLISDLIGGIRVTVIEEETVRVPAKRAMREKK